MYILSSSESKFLDAQKKIIGIEGDSVDWNNYIGSVSAKCSELTDSDIVLNTDLGQEGNGQITITNVCMRLSDIFTHREKYEKFLNSPAEKAQGLLDLLQKLLDHAPLQKRFRVLLYVALFQLCQKSGLCPKLFCIEGVTDKTEDPWSIGRFGDIFQARYKSMHVCLKVVRLYRESDQDLLYNAFKREAVLWGQLSHPNILPFYGVSGSPRDFCLVSPWISNSNVLDFLRQSPNADRPQLIFDVASGLEYLHMNGILHGDLKCSNVLVADSFQAVLSDFGFSYVTKEESLPKSVGLSSAHVPYGTLGFYAPEQLSRLGAKTRESDMFAFGIICYEMFNHPPLEVLTQTVVQVHGTIVYAKQFPERPRPKEYARRGMTDAMWDLMKGCWSLEPKDRPTATYIMQRMPHDVTIHGSNVSLFQRPGFDTMNGEVYTTIIDYLLSFNNV